MMDAYTHLDMSALDPVSDFQSRMASAGVDRALVAETWKGDNFPSLERIVNSNLSEFRVAPCFRPEATALTSMDFLKKDLVVALRVKTADLSHLGNVADLLDSSNKWLLTHAENGIAVLANELISIRQRYPRLRIYVPHLAWPRSEGTEDKDWKNSITALSRIRGVTVGISAVAHFSGEPFPHDDVAAFASHLLNLFPSECVVVGSDYPMFKADLYAQYMELAISWVHRTAEKWSPTLESTCFSNRIPLSQ